MEGAKDMKRIDGRNTNHYYPPSFLDQFAAFKPEIE